MERCIYCGDEKQVEDHFIPVSFNFGHVKESKRKKSRNPKNKNNLVPACRECNQLARDCVFETIDLKREFIQEKLEKRYRKVLLMPDWSVEQLKELGTSLRKNTELKLLAKKWITNRIAYPTVIYPEQPIRAELQKILALF